VRLGVSFKKVTAKGAASLSQKEGACAKIAEIRNLFNESEKGKKEGELISEIPK